MALFITFEGGEGSGKTSQAGLLHRRLIKLGIPTLLTREPGGTLVGDRIARWLKWTRDVDVTPLTELLMFNASRCQLVVDIIQPALSDDKVVICDRYTDSTIAYQGHGRGLDLGMVRLINNTATQGLTPDLTVMLDIPVETGLIRKRRNQSDRFEQEDLAFHQRVREGYLELTAAEPERWLVIDATQSKTRIRDVIWQRVSLLI